jgi:ribonuclease Z
VPDVAPAAIVVTLLGTGTPEPDPERFSAATLVEAGGMRFLFDAGRGASVRLSQIKVPIGSIDMTFITHFHSDHISGLSDLWLTGFLPNFGGRKSPMMVVGPTGTQKMAENLERSFEEDVRIRVQELRLEPQVTKIVGSDIDKETVVFDKNGIKIIAFLVEHGAVVKPAFGYRLDYAGRSVLLSGDTNYNSNVIKYGAGVDLLLHEVAAAPAAVKDSPFIKAVMALHTSPEECGQIFTLTKPKMAAYTHLALLRTPGNPPPTVDMIEASTRKTYTGPLVIGEDLTRFEIGQTVRVLRWNKTTTSLDPATSR